MYQYEYPHPAVTTDCVVFGFDGKDLHVLLIERGIEPFKGYWALPGGFMKMDETAEVCAKRELQEETNVKDIFLEQFHVFSAVNRDPRERVLTIAFIALVRKSDYNIIAGDDAVSASWFDWKLLPPLAFDHEQIIKEARQYLQERLHTQPLAFKLLDKHFKMSELQRLYELIYGTTFDRRNFMRKITASGFVSEASDVPDKCCAMPSMDMEQKTRGRKAGLFSFDEENFKKEKKRHRWRNPFDM